MIVQTNATDIDKYEHEVCYVGTIVYCRNCGKDNPDNSVYCGDCGANLNGSGATQQRAPYGGNNFYAAAPQKSAGLGIVLSVFWVGLGHLYAELMLKGLMLIVVFALLVSGMFVSLFIYSVAGMLLLSIATLVLWVWSIYDVNKMINQYNQHIRSTGNPPW